MEFKGTKEEMYEVGGVIYCQDTFNSVICEMSEDQTFATNDANAKLFIAAPELLEACKNTIEILESFDGGPNPSEQMIIDECKKAIEKALK